MTEVCTIIYFIDAGGIASGEQKTKEWILAVGSAEARSTRVSQPAVSAEETCSMPWEVGLRDSVSLTGPRFLDFPGKWCKSLECVEIRCRSGFVVAEFAEGCTHAGLTGFSETDRSWLLLRKLW